MFADKGDRNASGEASEKQYYVTDPHGNVVQLTDRSGKIIKTYEYDSFGNEVKPDSKDENPFRYGGEYYDKETEEIYLRARYYAPAVGRFLTRDSYTGEEDEPESLHLYVYCENDGVNMVDPSGHWGKFNGKYVHQDLVKEALTSVNVSMKFSTSTELHFNTLNGERLRLLLDGAILPDYLEKAKEGKKPFKRAFKKLYRSVIKKLKVVKDGNAFHGKSSGSLKKFKKKVNRELKKSKNKKLNAVMIGCALHSIQDYYAHSYVSDLVDYKENRHKYLTAKEKLKGRYRQKNDPYQKQNSYHSDWEKGKRNKKIHKEKKDNPLMHFRYDFRTGNWSWISVDSKDDNPRYKMAREETIKYIWEKLKYVR